MRRVRVDDGRGNRPVFRDQVVVGDQMSNELTVPVDVSVPGIFVLPGTGGQAVALNQDGSLNSCDNRARRGEIIVLYGTGEGQTQPPGVTGKLCSAPFATPLLPCTVSIDSKTANVLYCGCAPE